MYWSNNAVFVFFDPVHLGNTTFVVNGPSYEIKGLELQFVARVTDRPHGAGFQLVEQLQSVHLALPAEQSAHSDHPTPLGTASRSQQCAVHQSVRRDRHPRGVLAAVRVQRARAL